MKIKTRTFRGLTFDILVDEAQSVDAQGGRIWYTAAVYLRLKGQQERHLVRKSRLPGVADELAAEIRRDGIRVFDRFKPTRTSAATAAAQPKPATRPGQPRPHRHGGAQRQPAP